MRKQVWSEGHGLTMEEQSEDPGEELPDIS